MTTPEVDRRSPERRLRDEQIAAESPLAPLELPPDASSTPTEFNLGPYHRRPLAVAGIVENGLVRPLDTGIKLPEHARVIIVAAEEARLVPLSRPAFARERCGSNDRSVQTPNRGSSQRTRSSSTCSRPSSFKGSWSILG